MTISEQVDTGENQLPPTDTSLKDLCQAAVVYEVIYAFYNGSDGSDAVKHHHTTSFHQVPPLPIAMSVVGEMSQCRMTRVAEQSHCSSLFGEVNGTPKNGQELSFEPPHRFFLG